MEYFHILPLNIGHSYPVLHPVTKTSIEDGYQWLDDVNKLLEKDNLEDEKWISWATYHDSLTEPPPFPTSQSYMLTLFLESPTSPTMTWHAMKIHRTTTNQTPVMAADKPLLSLAKKLQWKFPQT